MEICFLLLLVFLDYVATVFVHLVEFFPVMKRQNMSPEPESTKQNGESDIVMTVLLQSFLKQTVKSNDAAGRRGDFSVKDTSCLTPNKHKHTPVGPI